MAPGGVALTGKAGWSYLAAFVGAATGALVGGVAGALLGVGLGMAAGEDFLAWGPGVLFGLLGLVGGVPLGVCVGWWHALNLTGPRPRPASTVILVGLVILAALSTVGVGMWFDGAAWMQWVLARVQPFQPWATLVGVLLTAGGLGALARALGERLR